MRLIHKPADLVEQNRGAALAAAQLRDEVVQALGRARRDRAVAERAEGRRVGLVHGARVGRGRAVASGLISARGARMTGA